ncbi:MAG: thioredoxin family protein [Leptospiraceae bacterium]|nr:thioredoxin family protein [Leptospiraceae bacterium]
MHANWKSKITIGILSILLALPVGLKAEDDSQWLSDLSTARSRAAREGQPILLDIVAPWCGYCRRMQQEVYPTTTVQKVSRHYVKVRINGEEHPDLMRQYGVTGFPTIVVMDPRGGPGATYAGYMDSDALARRLRDAYERSQTGPEFESALRNDPDSLHWNFEAGMYYHKSGDFESARRYFLRAHESTSDGAVRLRREALFNAAVASMDLTDYPAAIRYWGRYISTYPDPAEQYSYARYFRGLALVESGQSQQARADLYFASTHLRDPQDRNAAQQMLDQLARD